MDQQPIDPYAKWAFGTALVVHSGPGTVLGLVALRRIRRDGTRGAGLAKAAIALDIASIVIGTAVMAWRARRAREVLPDIEPEPV